MAEQEATAQDVQIKEVETTAVALASTVADIVVKDSETAAIADTYSKDIRAAIKRVEGFFDPMCDAANKAHKMLTTKRGQVLAPLKTALKANDGKIVEWARVEDEKRRVETEKARREAEKIEEDRRLELAVEAADAGDTELADEFLSAPVNIPASSVGPPPIKTEIKGLFDHWYAEVTNIDLLVRAWLGGGVPREAIQANESFLNKHAKDHKERFSVPGVIAKCEKRRRG